MRRWRLLLALAAARLILHPVGAVGQGAEGQQDCDLTGSAVARSVYGTIYISVVRLRCSDGMRVNADSAVFYQQARMYDLFGRVRIENAQMRLQSRNARYDASDGSITATGAVTVVRKQDNTSITNGESLILFQAGFAGRTADAMTVEGGRPHAVLRPRRAEGAPPDSTLPYEIDANRIEVTGQDQFRAIGQVQIRRGELNATADQVDYFGTGGTLNLTGSARLDTERHDLTGGVILVTMENDQITQVISRQNAKLSGDLELEAPLIQLDFTGGALDNVSAGPEGGARNGGRAQGPPGRAQGPPPNPAVPPTGPPGAAGATPAAPDAVRAVARAKSFTIEGDRVLIDVTADVLERVDAIGRARIVSESGDSLNAPDTPEIARRDWVEGDTIVATFTPVEDLVGVAGDSAVAAPDSARAPPAAADSAAAPEQRLERLVATGNARAFYRLPPSDTTSAPACDIPGRFAVHYVLGQLITVTMENGIVDQMEVAGQVAGQHLEPPPCRAAPVTDTTGAPSPGAGAPAPTPSPSGAPPPPPGSEHASVLRRSPLLPGRKPEPTRESR